MTSAWRAVTDAEMTGADFDAGQPFGAFAPSRAQRFLIRLAQRSVLKRGVFRGAVSRAIFALGSGKIDIRFRSAAYRLRGDDNLIEYGLLLNPAYNASDIEFLLADAPRNANFVDAGSNIGLYALPLALAAPEGQTLAIDANPRMASLLAWNAAASEISNLKIVQAGLSDTSGRARLRIRKDDVAIVAITEDPEGSVPLTTLENIVTDAGLTSLFGLTIDIEGHEDRVLVPFLDHAAPTLRPKRIVIEHQGKDGYYPGCLAAFERHGYRRVGQSRNNSFFERQ